jgi:2-oxoglutarate decarboxylase
MAAGTTIEVRMPEMGESVTEGIVLQWHKREGEEVRADETIVEISTDKVDAEVPAPASGTLAKIHVPVGETIEVGSLLAEIAPGDNGSGRNAATQAVNGAQQVSPPAANPSTQLGEATVAGNGEGQAPAPAPPSAEASPEGLVDVLTPAAGESVSEGTILEWLMKVGDAVREGETIVEISTDKVDLELPAPAGGTLAQILAPEGETVGVGQVIARIATSPGAIRSGDAQSPGQDGGLAPQKALASAGKLQAAPAPEPLQPGGSGSAPISPVAARLAQASGIDPQALTGSGPRGRILKADVLAVARSAACAQRGTPQRRAAHAGRSGS